MGTSLKYSDSPRVRKTIHLSAEISTVLEKIAFDLQSYCKTTSQSDVVEALLRRLKKDWYNDATKRQMLIDIWKF